MSNQAENAAGKASVETPTEVVGRSASGTELVALPPPPKDFAGTSQVSQHNYTVQVSNRDGYLSNIIVDALFDASPETIYTLFTHSDNSSAFRDIKSVAARKVVETVGKRTVVEVEQIGEMQVLWMKKNFSTFLRVVEDASDPDHMVIVFELLKSDVLARFHGRWDLEPVLDKETNAVKCQSKLTQDVSPKGVPPFFAHLPILGGVLRGIGVRTARRIIEDINSVVAKLKSGKTLDEILATPSTTANRQKSSCHKDKDTTVSSFAIEEEDDDDQDKDVVDVPDNEEMVQADGSQAKAKPDGGKLEDDNHANGLWSSDLAAVAVAPAATSVQDSKQGLGKQGLQVDGLPDKLHEAVVSLAQEAGSKQATEVAA